MPFRRGRVRAAVRAARCAILAAAVLAAPARAAVPSWSDVPYRYVVIDQDVRSILTEFGRNLGVPVVLSEAVRGRVRGEIRGEKAGAFLDELAGANGLVWYFDGSILHVGADSELATRVLGTGDVDAGAVVREMRRLDLADARFALRPSADGRALTISGPPAYVAAVEGLLQSMKPPEAMVRDDPRVRVFRGGLPVETVAQAPGNGDDGSRSETAQRR